mgnify:CR=1 FL=1
MVFTACDKEPKYVSIINIANELDNGNYCANIEIEFTDILT